MKISSIDFKTLPSKALKGVQDLGRSTRTLAREVKDVFVKHTPSAIKNNTDTIIGGGVIVAGLASIVKLISSIKYKAQETKKH